jgi:hypothetical protein
MQLAQATYAGRIASQERTNDLVIRMLAQLSNALADIEEAASVDHTTYMNALDEIKVLSEAVAHLSRV